MLYAVIEKKHGTKGAVSEATCASTGVPLESTGEPLSHVSADEPFDSETYMQRVLALSASSDSASASSTVSPTADSSARTPSVESCLAETFFGNATLLQLFAQASEQIRVADARAEQQVRALCRPPPPPSSSSPTPSPAPSAAVPTAETQQTASPEPEPDLPPADERKRAATAARQAPERASKADRPMSSNDFFKKKKKEGKLPF